MRQHHVIIDRDKCVGCSRCASVCVAHNIVIKNKKAETVLEWLPDVRAMQRGLSQKGHYGQRLPTLTRKRNRGISVWIPREVLEVIRFRRSIRRFKQEPVPNEVIDQILEAGTLTHTAKNMQDVSFTVLEKEKNRIEQMAVSMFKK